MSEENVAVVRTAVDAFNARDADRLLSLMDPEIEYRSAVEARVYRGHDGMLRYLEDVDATMEEWRVEDSRFVDACGDRVVHLYRMVGRGAGSGVRVTRDFAMLSHLRNGRLLIGEVYLDQRQALEAVGLRE